ncbi:hypothetical protein ACLKA7_015555 [Drosophila subpalustris]
MSKFKISSSQVPVPSRTVAQLHNFSIICEPWSEQRIRFSCSEGATTTTGRLTVEKVAPTLRVVVRIVLPDAVCPRHVVNLQSEQPDSPSSSFPTVYATSTSTSSTAAACCEHARNAIPCTQLMSDICRCSCPCVALECRALIRYHSRRLHTQPQDVVSTGQEQRCPYKN